MRTETFGAQAGAMILSVLFMTANVGLAEQDHLEGYKIKDLKQVPGAVVSMGNNFLLSQNCELKKPQFYLTRSEKNAGDDPRGATPVDYVCYKAKCTGPLVPDQFLDSQFGLHLITPKKTKLICLPAGPITPTDAAAVCTAYASNPGCTSCCDGVTSCGLACTVAITGACDDPAENIPCAEAIAAASCGLLCAP